MKPINRILGQGKIENIMVPPRDGGLNQTRFILIDGKTYTISKKTTFFWMERGGGGEWQTVDIAKFWDLKIGYDIRFIWRDIDNDAGNNFADRTLIHVNILTSSTDKNGMKAFDNPSHRILGDEPGIAERAIDDLFTDYPSGEKI